MKHYDYIIAGGGCAGLSLLARMLANDALHDKKILLVDRAPKTENDRTWCFWETQPGFFEDVVCHRWNKLQFHSGAHSREFSISPFTYKMIRGDDFYDYCFRLLEGTNVDVLYEEVRFVRSDGKRAFLQLKGQTISADYLFSSIMPADLVRQPGRQYLWQHFKGWTVHAESDCFIADTATLMDFRTSQQHGASFMYIMPFSARRAMVEYTVFSPALLPDASYTEGLQSYLQQRFPGMRYVVEEEERGKIPMTDHRFARSDGRVIYLGTMGGNTKASSGYTFSFIQSHAAQLTEALAATGVPHLSQRQPRRHRWYDAVLLRVLVRRKVPAEQVFDRLFCRNSPQRVLRFLDNSTTIRDELRLISTLPLLPFIRAAVAQCLRLNKTQNSNQQLNDWNNGATGNNIG